MWRSFLLSAKAAALVAAFAYVMLSGTVLALMGAGTGSGRHNRVAGAGIEPASGGYEPPEVPLLYPAIFILLCGHKFRHSGISLFYPATFDTTPV